MKSFEELLPLIVALVIAIVLLIGFLTAVTKSMGVSDQMETIDLTLPFEAQEKRVDDVQRLQKEHMRNQKERIRDLQRK